MTRRKPARGKGKVASRRTTAKVRGSKGRTLRSAAKPAVRPPAAATRQGGRILRARDLMTRTPTTVGEEMTVGDLCDLLQANNINGAPVVDEQGYLVGVIAQEDIIYGAMGHPEDDPAGGATAEPRSKPRGKRVIQLLRDRRLSAVPTPETPTGEIPFWSDARQPRDPLKITVGAIMTSPAISADEMTPIIDLCRIMWNLRIHRIPILKHGKVTGLVSSMDLCRAILAGKITV